YTVDKHNIYLNPPDSQYPADHPRNREVASSKGCITTDQIPNSSALHTLYNAAEFREFLCAVLDEAELHEYADSMSSINLHYASEGQELGWHFDNSSFAITLMIQNPESGGVFEYVKDVRDADSGEMNYELSGKILDGDVPTKTLTMDAGTLVLFRGRNSMHRVTPVIGSRTRMLVVLAYNTEPGKSLSESARMTFYGRLG
ncbi:MAG: 2OG-Fe(II) oxygenase, partial [Gammaproteobacteria bacterium]|nr:2OG-Fe(II) oxygenase [Gammaproteobacteria bacterium]